MGRFVVGFAANLMLRHARGVRLDTPESYLWLVGWVYVMAVMCATVSAYSAYAKPASDRKVDLYLQRKLALDSSRFSQRDPESEAR